MEVKEVMRQKDRRKDKLRSWDIGGTWGVIRRRCTEPGFIRPDSLPEPAAIWADLIISAC